jgi:Flp pilus assembly protein TadD
VLLQIGDRRGAIREYEKALALSPRSATAHYNLGVVLVAEGNVAAAEQHFREAITYAPYHFEAHMRLGQILSARGEALLAAPHLLRAAESPDARIRSTANELLRPR